MCSLVCIGGAATPQHHFPVQQIALPALTTTVKSTVGQVSLSQHLFPDHLELNQSSSTCLRGSDRYNTHYLCSVKQSCCCSACSLSFRVPCKRVPPASAPSASLGVPWAEPLGFPSQVLTTCDTDPWQLYPLSASIPSQMHTGHAVWADV